MLRPAVESVAALVHVNDRADFGVLVSFSHFAGGAVIVIAEVLEMGANFVRHLEGVQRRIGGEEAAVVGGGCSGRRWLHHELFLALLEAAQDGIGDLAVHLDMAFAGKGEGVRGGSRGGGGEMGIMGIMGVMSVGGANRAGVAEQAAKDVGEEVGEQGGFLEIVGAAGCDEFGPVLEFGLPVPRALGQVEGPHLLAEDFRVEERFGFEGHWDLRFTIYERRAKRKTAVLGKPVSAYLTAREEQVHPRGKFRKLFITRHEMVLQEKLGGRQQ